MQLVFLARVRFSGNADDFLGKQRVADDFLGALRHEIERLQSALSSDRRYVRLQQLLETLRLYENNNEELQLLRGPAIEARSGQPGRPPSPDRDRILREAARYIYEREPQPCTTREILLHLTGLGLEFEGASPVNNLSAMLSASKTFFSHGRSGWTLTSTVLRQVLADFIPEIPIIILRDSVIQWDSQHSLESSLDGFLLSKTREKLGRDLEVEERTRLRDWFVDMAKQRLA